MNLGERVARARQYLSAVVGKKISQAELAARCDWKNGQGRIGNYETGKRLPSAKDVMTIARVTGVRVEWLQYEKGYMHEDHAAIAYHIKEPGGDRNRDDPPPEVLAVSESLRQLMLKLMAMEQAGVLNAAAIQSLIGFLDSLSEPNK